jgi:hypothetical protein
MATRKLDGSFLVCLGTGLFLMMAIGAPCMAQSPEAGHRKKMISGKRAEHCAEMKQHHQKMMEEMKARDAELDELAAKMNAAPQDQKVDLMAEIVTRMVKERSAMHAKMEGVQGGMLERMPIGRGPMGDCPTMKEMEEKPHGAHRERK